MKQLSLHTANRVIAATLAKGRELGLNPLCVAVLDEGGHVLAMQREDGASHMRPQIAIAKAAGALGLGVSSRTIATMAAERPTFVASLASMAPQGLIPAAGGLLIHGERGTIGAVGVTGDTSDNDETCALAGLSEAGLSAVN